MSLNINKNIEFNYLKRSYITVINLLQRKKLCYFDYDYIYYVYRLFEYYFIHYKRYYEIRNSYYIIEKYIVDRFGSIIEFYKKVSLETK